MELSTMIALLSLVISLATLMFTHLRPPKLTTLVGPTVHLGYPPGGGFSVSVPVAFSNHGAQTGGIFRAAATIYRSDAPHERHFMQWDSFMKLDFQAGFRWVHEELAHTLAIPGKSTVAKRILFVWYPTSQPALVIRDGVYELVLHFWTSERAMPRSETHRIVVSPSTLADFEDTGDPEKSWAAILELDQQLEANKFMNEFEYRALLERKLGE